MYGVSRDFLRQREPNRPLPWTAFGKTRKTKKLKIAFAFVRVVPQRELQDSQARISIIINIISIFIIIIIITLIK